MKVAFDTSVLVPALTPALPAHAHAYAWVRAAVDGRLQGVMSWHAFAESAIGSGPGFSGAVADDKEVNGENRIDVLWGVEA